MTGQEHCGYVAIVGRPNVGKSTLLNQLLGQKLSITSRREQTTRHTLLGICTRGQSQTLYVDTPGMHNKKSRALNRFMNREAVRVLQDVDLVLLVIERDRWKPLDEEVLARLEKLSVPVLLIINKIDQLKNKNRLLPLMAESAEKRNFAAIVPVSAESGEGREELQQVIESLLPPGPKLFPDEQITDRSNRFLAAEAIREKLTRLLGEELPHQLAVQIDEYVENEDEVAINATIYVERSSQKPIVVGRRGERLKRTGTEARLELQQMLGKPVVLRTWVKVRSGWSDDERVLRSLGYGEGS